MDQFLSVLSLCFPCFPNLASPYLSVNGTKYKIVKLLGEGGFSYVYLVSQKSTNALYALKRIRCPFGANDDAFKNVMKEIKNYHRFSNSKTPYIIQSIDEAVTSENDGSSTVHILLPYFEKSLQDIINANVLNGVTMEEDELLRILIGICRGIQVMHKYKKVGKVNSINQSTQLEEADMLLPPDSDEGDEVSENSGLEMEESVPFAHRDIKPGNIMLSPEGLPVLIDLGSCTKARLSIKTRQQALTLMDFAAEHCTLPYRAPELLDVSTDAEITEKTDIWSLGCLLYSSCFGVSPFEKLEIEQGANLTVAISNGNYTIPNSNYSAGFLGIIESCLKLDPESRPSIDEVLETALDLTRP